MTTDEPHLLVIPDRAGNYWILAPSLSKLLTEWEKQYEEISQQAESSGDHCKAEYCSGGAYAVRYLNRFVSNTEALVSNEAPDTVPEDWTK